MYRKLKQVENLENNNTRNALKVVKIKVTLIPRNVLKIPFKNFPRFGGVGNLSLCLQR